MPTGIGAAVITLQAAGAPEPGGGGGSWWDFASGALLAAAGLYATWAQFVYPRILERRARTDLEHAPPPVSATPPAPPVDLVGFAFRDQAQRVDDLLDELSVCHKQRVRDATTIARLTAELAECRRRSPTT